MRRALLLTALLTAAGSMHAGVPSRDRVPPVGLSECDGPPACRKPLRPGSLKRPGNRPDVPASGRRFTATSRDLPVLHLAAGGADAASTTATGDPAYGAYLSGDCVTCHRSDGTDQGIPSITGWPVEDFVAAMQAYKTGARPHPVMQMMAGRLTDDEIAALAAYFNGVR